MKRRNVLKNYYLVFSLILSFVFLLIHEHHECEGDGCLICLFSLITFFITNAALLIKFIPTIVEKITLYIHTIYSRVLASDLDEEKQITNYNPININNCELTDLITFGVKIQ
ncbi:MAG: hypothetical protein J6T15_06955 [Bacilli bacterium]|nr:hypothetical protein [Bacilli bacterium]